MKVIQNRIHGHECIHKAKVLVGVLLEKLHIMNVWKQIPLKLNSDIGE